jgi:hypothetical protein
MRIDTMNRLAMHNAHRYLAKWHIKFLSQVSVHGRITLCNLDQA